MKDASTLVDTLVATGQTADTTHSVRLIKGNIECSSCHNPHMQAVDKQSPNFLVRDNAKAGLCLSCHETKPRIVCWNFDANRSLKVNGQAVPCLVDAGFVLDTSRAGGYCIQVGPGGSGSAGLLLPVE